MNVIIRQATLAVTLLGCAGVAQAASTIFTTSIVCSRAVGGDTCEEDGRYGNSSLSRQNKFVQPPGSAFPDNAWNYVAEARAGGSPGSFALFGRAAGNSFANPISGPLGMSASALIAFHDEVIVAGSGPGTIVIPWHVTGTFDLIATSGGAYTPGASFGANFCQSIPVNPGSAGKSCTGGGSQVFNASDTYDQTLLLEYAITLGQEFSLNTTFTLGVYSGAGLAVGMAGDFSHTGLQQAARVYDSNRIEVLNPVITAASGLDYLHPQAAAVPAPAAMWLLGTGIWALSGLAWRRRRAA